ncbi:MAG TPA: PLP-dependent aminotransferase family protein [Gemmatimonadaceae bacterium]|jgi:2-aminoadipate transaminase|nr:PLP-dependent aminotransferase family protein [Gemmatimonadaceae bacterium]
MHAVSWARRAAELSPAMPVPAPAGNISFDSGHAFPGVLPDLTREAEGALSRCRTETLQYAPRPGLPDLRRWIAEYMCVDGARVTASNILVTNGAKHAIELMCRVLLDEGDAVVVTAPTYFSAIPIIRSFGAIFLEVGQDDEGLDVAELAALLDRLTRDGRALPRFIYNVPDFHNPTGITMSLERRQALIDLAVRYQIFIIEDSPYRQVRFEGASVPSLKALDTHDVVVQLGTFSKLMAPGLRVGWAAAAPGVVARMAQLKTDAGSCPLTQRIIFEFCAAGRLGSHTTRVQEAYRSNRDRMVAAIQHALPDVAMTIPHGGYYLWLTLPHGMNGDAVAERASALGVTVLAGSKFFARRDTAHPTHHLRVAFSHATHDEIDEGVRRLAAAYHGG